jgi:hypothetical protein
MSKLKVNEIYKHSGSQVTIVDALSTASAVTLGAETTFKEDVIMDKDLGITGNLNVVGTATISGGSINIGDADSDRLNIRADITSNILPDASNTYDLGSPGKKWNYVHASTLSATAVSVTSVDSSTGNFTTDVTVGGTVDGRDVSVDGTALDVVKAASGTWDAASALSQTNETTLDTNSASWSAAGALSQTNETTLATSSGDWENAHTGVQSNSANWDLTYDQVQDASTDLNVDSGTLFVDKSENRVGIGSTTPLSALHVNGGAQVDGKLAADGGIEIRNNGAPQSTTATVQSWDIVGNNKLRLRSINDEDIEIAPSIHSRSRGIAYFTDADVGIGTTTPLSALHVVGTGKFTSDIAVGGNIDIVGNISGTAGTSIQLPEIIGNNAIHIRTIGNDHIKLNPGTGNVAVGDFVPTEKLTVAGTVSAQGFKTDGAEGVTGTFVDNSSNTITVKNGIITSLS